MTNFDRIKSIKENIEISREIIKDQQELLATLHQDLKREEKGFYPNSYAIPFNPDLALDFVETGLDSSLNDAFDWTETPQGGAYWERYYLRREKASPEDREIILKWIINYYRSVIADSEKPQ